jgi:hypothetical protein
MSRMCPGGLSEETVRILEVDPMPTYQPCAVCQWTIIVKQIDGKWITPPHAAPIMQS